MTEEEKKAQEEAAAREAEAAAAANAGGDGNAENGEDPESAVQAKDGNGAPVTEPMPKDVFFERIRTNVPDGKFEDDEQEYYRHAMEILDKAEDGSNKYKGLTEKLTRRYQEDPEEVAILMDYIEGMPLMAAIVKHKGEEALTMKEGDEGWEDYQQEVGRRKEARETYMKLMDEVENNSTTTAEEFNKWADELKLDDEQRKAVWDLMQSDLDNMTRGKISRDVFDRYSKALNYERDVEGAHEQGKAEGKNEAIEAKRKQMKGSGLPNGGGGNSEHEEAEETTDPTAQWLAAMIHR
ncbi:MAG: hypothetical protein IJ640_00340 [Prevotella sp.]|nr:hypothetical protein [Paludibacteraceae bacterium]MBR1525094.1 hypothetical protein [Prevotella sp.]